MARRGMLPYLQTVGGRRLFIQSDVERLATARGHAGAPAVDPVTQS
jgi:hypothetical protein